MLRRVIEGEFASGPRQQSTRSAISEFGERVAARLDVLRINFVAGERIA
jgi:hypothetical protein